MSGPVGGKTYDAQMVPMGMNDDEWIAAVASYVRNSAGHEVNATLSKMLTHDISLDLGYTWITRTGAAGQDQWSLGVRYKF